MKYTTFHNGFSPPTKTKVTTMPRRYGYKKKKGKMSRKGKKPSKKKRRNLSRAFGTKNAFVGGSTSTAPLAGLNWVPSEMKAQHVVAYTWTQESVQITPGSGPWPDELSLKRDANTTTWMSLNDPYDPWRGTAFGGSATGYPEAAALYNKRLTYAAKVEVECNVMQTSTDCMAQHVLTWQVTPDQPGYINDFSDEMGLLLTDDSPYKIFHDDPYKVVTRKMKRFYRLGDILGRDLDPSQDEAASGSSPTQNISLYPRLLFTHQAVGTGPHAAFTYRIKVTYYTLWSDPKRQNTP